MPVVKSQSRLLEEAKRAWRKASAVCFDVDSTLISVEGIIGLAHLCGAEDEVAQLTKQAMGGSMTFREALWTRLNIIKPTLHQVMELRKHHTPDQVLTPQVETLIRLLQSRGTKVYLVSGGFRQLIEPFAEHLGIPQEDVFANRLIFADDGQFTGFDESEPTSQSGGKAFVMGQVKQKYDTVVMIGDGATDMEASPPADTFIGFGGNVVREKVRDGAPWFVYSFQELIDELRPLENGQTSNGEHVEQIEAYTNGATVEGKYTNGFTNHYTNGYTDTSSELAHLKMKTLATVPVVNGAVSTSHGNDVQRLD